MPIITTPLIVIEVIDKDSPMINKVLLPKFSFMRLSSYSKMFLQPSIIISLFEFIIILLSPKLTLGKSENCLFNFSLRLLFKTLTPLKIMILKPKYSYSLLGEVMIIKINKFICAFILILFFVFLILNEGVFLGVKKGIDLSLNVIIPSILPYTVLSLMFLKSGGLYYLSKIIGLKDAIWFISSIGGYPAGALILKELENSCDKNFLKKAVIYSVNAGPSFVFAVVGMKIFNNKIIGFILLFSHLFISLLFCIFTKNLQKISLEKPPVLSPFNLFFSSLETGLISIAKICITVVFSSCIFETIKLFEPLKLFSLLFEVTVGITECNKNIYLATFLISFSGISVIMQVKMILKNLISFKDLFLQKFLHGILSTALVWLIFLIFPITKETISNGVYFNIQTNYVSIASGIALIFMCIVFILAILRQKNNREFSRLKF